MRYQRSLSRGVIATLLVAFVLGAVLGAATVASGAVSFGAVRIDRAVTGVVAIVNGPGDAVCITEDKTGTQLCSNLLQRAGSPALTVGEHVSATRIWISGQDALVMTSSPRPS
jgi:hypothetical protein